MKMSPAARVKFAWTVLVVCIIAWPLTSLTIFSSEPQAVIALSWIALILSAFILVVTTDVRKKQENEE